MGKDILGSFHVPKHLLEKAAAYVAPVVEKPKAKPATKSKQFAAYPGRWATIQTYRGSNGTSIHTVEGTINNQGNVELKCSCQGFRIQKKGYCKHTKLARQEFDL